MLALCIKNAYVTQNPRLLQTEKVSMSEGDSSGPMHARAPACYCVFAWNLVMAFAEVMAAVCW